MGEGKKGEGGKFLYIEQGGAPGWVHVPATAMG